MMKRKKKQDEKGKKHNEKKGERKKLEKQIKIGIYLMIGSILLLLLIYFLFSGIKKFEYGGVSFEKGKKGNLVLYLAKFPLIDVTGNVVAELPFYFREDPRKLKNIQVNGNIRLKRNVAEAYNKDLEVCEDGGLAVTTMSVYLKSFGINTFPATTNKNESAERDVSYVSCNETEKYSVILFKRSDKNLITKEGDCYILEFSDCNIVNVTERFMLGLYSNSRGIEI